MYAKLLFAVYKAVDTGMPVPHWCVIKEIQPDQKHPSWPKLKELCEREAKILQSLHREELRIPRLLYYQQGFIVEEFIDGDTLHQVVSKQTLNEQKVTVIKIVLEMHNTSAVQVVM